MPEFDPDVRDLRFCLFEHIRVGDLAALEPFAGQDEETWRMVLDQADKMARNLLAPLNQPGDEEGAHYDDGVVTLPKGFKEAYRAYCDNGWPGLALPEEFGGSGMPATLAVACGELVLGACLSFVFTPGLTTGAAEVLIHGGDEHLQKTYLPKMVSGQWSGTMCLTEPQAGSAVGDSRTTAVRQDDGSYAIEGTKIFITQGEHDLTENIIHLVLARTPGAQPGTKGLSLFVVPKFLVNADGSVGAHNDVRCSGIEEKMGIHGSPTCTMVFGDNGTCRGWIIGQEGDGMRLMFHMMNEARIQVGLQGAGLGNAAWRAALAYAKERVQGVHISNLRDPEAPRVAIIEHPNVRQMLMECKALAEGVRALVLKAALYSDLSRAAATEEERSKYGTFLGILTPIVKAYGSEAGLRIADVAIQVHGGYGYIREYGVEQYLRDAKIATIYEGTNSIQALDLIGRKVPRRGGQDFMALIAELDAFLAGCKDHMALCALAEKVAEAKDALVEITMTFGGYNMQGNLSYPAMHAKAYLEMFGDILLAWYLLEQAAIAEGHIEDFQKENPELEPEEHAELAYYDGKVQTAAFFVHQILPRVHRNAARVRSQDQSALNIVL